MRLLRSTLLLYFLTWSLFIIPAHTRGIISLGPSSSTATPTTPMFFASLPSCCSKPSAPADKKQKSPTNCAICQLAATTPHAPFTLLFDPQWKFLERFTPPIVHTVALFTPLTYFSRGPPQSA